MNNYKFSPQLIFRNLAQQPSTQCLSVKFEPMIFLKCNDNFPSRLLNIVRVRMSSRSRKKLSVPEKVAIFYQLHCGAKNIDMCRKYSLSPSKVSRLSKNKDIYISKILKKLKLSDVDAALYQWYTTQKKAGELVDTIALKAQAEKFAIKFGRYDILRNNIWVDLFSIRNNILCDRNSESIHKPLKEEGDSGTKQSIEYSDDSSDFSEDDSIGGMAQSPLENTTSQRLKSTMVTKIINTIEKNANAKTQKTVTLGQQEILDQYVKVISESDESRAFGEYVATEIQKYPADLRLTTKRQIIQILIDSMSQLESSNKTTTSGANQTDNYQITGFNPIHPTNIASSKTNNCTSIPTPNTYAFIKSEPEEIITDYTPQSINKSFVKLENAAHSTVKSTNESDVNPSSHINLSNPRSIVKDEIHIDTEYESSDESVL